jgi:hypothetical protein
MNGIPVPLLWIGMVAVGATYALLCLLFGLLLSAASGLPVLLTVAGIALPPVAAVIALLRFH